MGALSPGQTLRVEAAPLSLLTQAALLILFTAILGIQCLPEHTLYFHPPQAWWRTLPGLVA
jgi:hypothetical protein